MIEEVPFPRPKGEWATLLRTLGTDAPSSPTSFGALLSPDDAGGAEAIMTTLGPKMLSQHSKELGVNRQMVTPSVAGSDASGDENADRTAAAHVPMKVCTFKSKEAWSNFSASQSGDLSAGNLKHSHARKHIDCGDSVNVESAENKIFSELKHRV